MLNGGRLTEKSVYISASTKGKQKPSLIIIGKNTTAAFVQCKIYIIFQDCNI